MNLDKYRLDLAALDEGRWFAFYDDLRVRISSAQGARYQKALEALQSTRRRNMPELTPDGADDNIDAKRVVADFLVHDWQNMQLGGVDVPFSHDKAYELFCDPELIEFYQWVIGVTMAMARFRQEQIEADSGN